MKLSLFCTTCSLNVSHVNGIPSHLLGNKNSAWTRAKAKLCWRFSLTRVYCKQRNVRQNPMSPQGCSEKETTGKMGTKQLVSSARQRTCTSVACGQKAPCQAQCTALEHPPYSPDLSPPDLFLFLRLKSVLKGQ